jgi:hypothetical protein
LFDWHRKKKYTAETRLIPKSEVSKDNKTGETWTVVKSGITVLLKTVCDITGEKRKRFAKDFTLCNCYFFAIQHKKLLFS